MRAHDRFCSHGSHDITLLRISKDLSKRNPESLTSRINKHSIAIFKPTSLWRISNSSSNLMAQRHWHRNSLITWRIDVGMQITTTDAAPFYVDNKLSARRLGKENLVDFDKSLGVKTR